MVLGPAVIAVLAVITVTRFATVTWVLVPTTLRIGTVTVTLRLVLLVLIVTVTWVVVLCAIRVVFVVTVPGVLRLGSVVTVQVTVTRSLRPVATATVFAVVVVVGAVEGPVGVLGTEASAGETRTFSTTFIFLAAVTAAAAVAAAAVPASSGRIHLGCGGERERLLDS